MTLLHCIFIATRFHFHCNSLSILKLVFYLCVKHFHPSIKFAYLFILLCFLSMQPYHIPFLPRVLDLNMITPFLLISDYANIIFILIYLPNLILSLFIILDYNHISRVHFNIYTHLLLPDHTIIYPS